jgi:uncharacterized integral membrane protein (TIGR00698 family)
VPSTRTSDPSRALRAVRVLPGLAIAVGIAAISTVVGHVVPLVGSAVPGIIIGVIVGFVIKPGARLKPGITFASKFVLQLSVVLLGTQLSIAEVAQVGLQSLPVMLGTLVICLAAAWLFGRLLGVVGDVRTLVGVGTGICGASAIAAVAPVIGAVSADVAYAVSTIFLFNITAVIVFPIVGHALGMSQHAFGLFAGTAVNDTSSVVAAASTYGSAAANYAVVVKLVRTLMIIPISIGLATLVSHRTKAIEAAETAEQPAETPAPIRTSASRVFRLIPWFLIGFVIMAIVNSTNVIPAGAHPELSSVSIFLISVALSAIGLSTDLGALRRAGARPLLLGALLWITVSLSSLGLQWAMHAL